MSRKSGDEIININVGGKKFTVRRSVLCADSGSKMADWFRQERIPGRALAQDKSGNFFLERDGKSFRHVLCYLRFKREGLPTSLALPDKPAELNRLSGEAAALGLHELSDMCRSMLGRYTREEVDPRVAFSLAAIQNASFSEYAEAPDPRGQPSFDDW